MLAFGGDSRGNEDRDKRSTDVQVEPIVVAYCTKPRNNARLIPDGTIQSAHVSCHFLRYSERIQFALGTVVWPSADGCEAIKRREKLQRGLCDC